MTAVDSTCFYLSILLIFFIIEIRFMKLLARGVEYVRSPEQG